MTNRIWVVIAIAAVLAVLIPQTVLAQGSKPVTNEQLVALAKAGFDEEGLIGVVQTSGNALDLSVDGLLALKSAGISQKVINAALAAKAKAADGGAARNDANALEVGVYVLQHDKPVPMEPEIVNYRSGFAKINAFVKGGHSPLQVTGPVTFQIRCAEGVSAAEYQLLKLDEKGERREFRAATGGFASASTGADRNMIPFKFERIAPRTFQVVLTDVKRGEYAFLPPGANVSASAASAGKLYTFGIKE